MKKLRFRKIFCLMALMAVIWCVAAPCQAFSPNPSPIAETAAPPALRDGEVMDYFAELVFDAEYGGGDTQNALKRWEQPIRVRVYGNPTEQDLATLNRHIDDLNQVENMPDIQLVNANENMQIFFVPLDDIHNHIDGYVEGNWGFFWGWWNGDWQMTDAQIAIATDVTDQRQRNHLILEEFTQALGIMQDSMQYPDSIFYGRWTEAQQLSPLDWTVVRMVYSPGIQAGMTAAEVIDRLRQ
ncbi:MAG: DUF2927 domain-containing protein [Bacillota bacterium]